LTAMDGISLTMTTGMTHSVARCNKPLCKAHKPSTCNSTAPPIKTVVRCEGVKLGWFTTSITSSVGMRGLRCWNVFGLLHHDFDLDFSGLLKAQPQREAVAHDQGAWQTAEGQGVPLRAVVAHGQIGVGRYVDRSDGGFAHRALGVVEVLPRHARGHGGACRQQFVGAMASVFQGTEIHLGAEFARLAGRGIGVVDAHIPSVMAVGKRPHTGAQNTCHQTPAHSAPSA